MSKSKGNFYALRDLLKKNLDTSALRFLLLSTHYRKMLNFSFDALKHASASLQRIKDFLYELRNRSFEEGENKRISKLINDMNKKFKRGLSDDLNISVALTAIFEMIRKINTLIFQGKVYRTDAENLVSSIHSLDQVLAVLPEEKEMGLPSEMMSRIEKREKARQENNYKLADEIREELLQQGIVLEDTKDGVRWKIKK
jgi:cysteinyl-tRNA synthetase